MPTVYIFGVEKELAMRRKSTLGTTSFTSAEETIGGRAINNILAPMHIYVLGFLHASKDVFRSSASFSHRLASLVLIAI